VIVIPTHPCLPDDSHQGPAVAYGELDAQNVATCAVRVRWGEQRWQDERLPGCGARIGVCHGCGLRTRVTLPGEAEAPPCAACSATRRPDVVAAAPETSQIHAAVDPTRSIVQQAAPRDAVRPQETKPARRVPARRVKKGAAGQGDGPLFK
jgi:hypothetical protein